MAVTAQQIDELVNEGDDPAEAARAAGLRHVTDGRPAIRARITQDLRKDGLPKEKVLAAVVRLLETTLIRVGNDEYARDNRSYGLTTMRDRHVKVRGDTVRFEFVAKGGQRRQVDLR